MNHRIVAGLTTAAAVLAIATPAVAQVAPGATAPPTVSPAQPVAPGGTTTPVVPPAQPAAPTNLQPGITAHINGCVAKVSSHGYSYAVCPVVVENMPYYQAVQFSFKSSMKTFKPRTSTSWSNQTGTLKLSSGGSLAGDTTTVTGKLKFAFPKARLSTVERDLKVSISTTSSDVFVSQPTAVVSAS
jgi:hypothetical protein